MKKKPPFPARNATPTVSSDTYQIPFMYSGIPIWAPRFHCSNPVDRLRKWTIPATSAPPTSIHALRIPAPGAFSTAAVAIPPGNARRLKSIICLRSGMMNAIPRMPPAMQPRTRRG